jgi:HK97 family phage major capsid protein
MNVISKMTELEAYLRENASIRTLIFNDGTKVDELRDELVTLSDQAKTLQATADAEKRGLSDEENTEIEKIFARFEFVEAEIDRREKIADTEARIAEPLGRKTDPDDVAASSDPDHKGTKRRTVAARPRDTADVGRHGFRSFGEFAQSVKAAVRAAPGGLDPRLTMNAPTTTSTEGVGADGGFAVPPDFRTAITEKVMGVDSLLARTDQLTSASNSITLPKDETTPWQSTGGIQAFWEGEGSLITQSKVALEQTTIRLNKLTALVPVTEELLEDASALSTYINRKAPQKFDYKIQNAIINGTGAGQPKGILASDALVEVAKESGQVADTVLAQNITNMWARMYAPSRSNAIWLINQDVEPQLDYLQMPGTNPTAPLFMPAGGLSASPFATLKGRPVVPVEACKTLGDVGDIILADLTQYMTAMKTGGIRQDVSMHLLFDYDTLAFRFILRMAGLPWWGSAITPANGSNTLSCFVSLAARG